MKVTHIKASKKEDLVMGLIDFSGGAMRFKYQNVIGPVQGSPAVAASKDANGNIIPEQPAKGDKNKFYVSILHDDAVTPFQGCETCDTQEGIDVCGVWG